MVTNLLEFWIADMRAREVSMKPPRDELEDVAIRLMWARRARDAGTMKTRCQEGRDAEGERLMTCDQDLEDPSKKDCWLWLEPIRGRGTLQCAAVLGVFPRRRRSS